MYRKMTKKNKLAKATNAFTMLVAKPDRAMANLKLELNKIQHAWWSVGNGLKKNEQKLLKRANHTGRESELKP